MQIICDDEAELKLSSEVESALFTIENVSSKRSPKNDSIMLEMKLPFTLQGSNIEGELKDSNLI